MLEHLKEIRRLSNGSSAQTTGLSDEIIRRFCILDNQLVQAIEEASLIFTNLIDEVGLEYLAQDEAILVSSVQSDYINFYSAATINPYVAIAASGPWVITSKGAVLHDNGSYGMLGGGHGPDAVIEAMSQNWVMANVMTPSFSQQRLSNRLRNELGHTRGECPFSKFICMNSGSESVAVSLRIADVNANRLTGAGGRHEGKPIKLLAIEQAFHGRTDRPAQISHSCKDGYDQNLASFRDRDNLLLVPPNDIESLRSIFSRAEEDGFFIELMAIEPVQGEGNPGQCVTREFYDEARRLTLEHGSMLLVDSIQAGLRGRGCLSIIDYPGFETCGVPDLETWSKALNAGQFPLSVLGLSPRASELYVVGIYGNTMTTNPRALETAVAVLDQITPELRNNIRERGVELISKLELLAAEYPDVIVKVQGTGLLCCAELNPETHPVVGFGQIEEHCRKAGLGVIHGGQNALRFTPHFSITTEEIDLIIDLIRQTLSHYGTLNDV
ncbi:MAG: aminotransferase class III-fold pyridoxal phosphate-dependent enzyme [Candidatus Thalassarchaeaceae archaeon]|nr:aminotransferase class III-fold pyridoxal phosphate-dependent enzyme [Candidatus Thalassarchaeaceae archaeon]